ncbi:hypothetical protein SAY86_003116 [Trapa natans]|uniref:Ribosome associated membrane protein RAMP4 n=1 Tax=Trapa natans TaxID=22666 RepID=A0AAN7LUT1_TRANT|nr:hypothetical protein SAY86_003116 [Trapa natans]
MTTSRRLADRKVEKFDKNITKRGAVPETTVKKGKDYPVGPLLLGFFVFVVIGSFFLTITSVPFTFSEYSNFPDHQDSHERRHGLNLHINHGRCHGVVLDMLFDYSYLLRREQWTRNPSGELC